MIKMRILKWKSVFILLLVLFPLHTEALESNEEPQVLVAFSSTNGEMTEQQRMLDMLIGHFTANIVFKHVSEVTEKDIQSITHLFYSGNSKERLPDSFTNLLEAFNGPVIAIGHNVTQLGERFNFLKIHHKERISSMELVGETDKVMHFFPRTIFKMEIDMNTQVLIQAKHGKKYVFPMLVNSNNTYYYATETLAAPFDRFLAEVLHEVFEEQHDNVHPAYIRLEDVHPLVEPKKLMAIAEILEEKEIPYMVAVIPVYVNPETNEVHDFSDYPSLLNVLKYIQSHGGSIVMHGYTHQFRSTETGEGFEFWDVKYNMPIYHEPDEQVVKESRNDFASQLDYEHSRQQQLLFETTYIEDKLTKGVKELAKHGIYPLAFEAPHYTMSQNGYQVTANYFSTYVGQVQISDRDWEIMVPAPYITTPSFLHGMELLPETIGYVDPEDPKAIEKMVKNALEMSIVRDGIIAGFYHPYLGVEKFIELINEMEKLPRLEWIDLKQMPNSVKADRVDIHSKSGEIIADIQFLGLFTSTWELIRFSIRSYLPNVIWAVVGAGTLGVTLFTLYILYMRRKMKSCKRREYFG